MKSVSLETAARTLTQGQHVESRTRLPFKPADVAPLVDPEDNVVLGGDDNRLHCYSPAGTERWSAPLHSPLTHPPARDDDGNLYVAGTISVEAFSPDGKPLWQGKAPWTLAGTPQPVGDKVYVGTTAGELLEFDREGKCRNRGKPWKAPVPLYVSPGPEGALIVTRASGDMMVYRPDALLFKKGSSKELPGMLNRPPTQGPGGKLYLSCMAPGMRYSLATIDPATAELKVVARFDDFQPISPPGVGPAGVAIAVAGEGMRVYDEQGGHVAFPARTDRDMVPWAGREPRVVSAQPGSLLVTGNEAGTVALGEHGAFKPETIATSGLTPPAASSRGRYVVASFDGELIRISPDPVLAEEEETATAALEQDFQEQVLRIGPIELAIEE